MKLIKTDAQLRTHLPNFIDTARGETSYVDRLAIYLNLAEDWVKSNFTSEGIFDSIVDCDDDDVVKMLVSRIVAAEALHRAIPSLDIVLTPNGFGIVNTSNIAPASQNRVESLARSMIVERDECLNSLLKYLPKIKGWLDTEQCRYFSSTLFPNFDIITAVPDNNDSKWERYCNLYPQIRDIEASLANGWFSPELMAQLRKENAAGELTRQRAVVVAHIKDQIIDYLKNQRFNKHRLSDIVDFIRKHKEDFEEWHSSEVALLFNPPVFQNKKRSSGYFF